MSPDTLLDVNQIIALVSERFSIPEAEIMGPKRTAPIVRARHVAIFITRQISGLSWKDIGFHFAGRDHTSVMHAYQSIEHLMRQDPYFFGEVESLLRELNPFHRLALKPAPKPQSEFSSQFSNTTADNAAAPIQVELLGALPLRGALLSIISKREKKNKPDRLVSVRWASGRIDHDIPLSSLRLLPSSHAYTS